MIATFFKWAGLILWIVGVVGTVGALFVGEFLGRSYVEWLGTLLIGWCAWLSSTKADR